LINVHRATRSCGTSDLAKLVGEIVLLPAQRPQFVGIHSHLVQKTSVSAWRARFGFAQAN